MAVSKKHIKKTIPAKKKAKPKVTPNPKKQPPNKPKPNRSAGRPAIYNQDLADQICAFIASSTISLKKICKKPGMPSIMTVFRWLNNNTNGFCDQYARAKEQQADLMVEEMLDISDDDKDDEKAFVGGNHIQRDKLKVDTRKWIASKLKPKKYGEKLDVTTKTDESNLAGLSEDDLLKLAELQNKVGAK